jgi:hypothetical protein
MDEVAMFNVSLTENDLAELRDKGITAAVSPAGKLASTWGDLKQQ